MHELSISIEFFKSLTGQTNYAKLSGITKLTLEKNMMTVEHFFMKILDKSKSWEFWGGGKKTNSQFTP